MFLSKNYAEKPWPRLERQSAQARALQAHTDYIIPIRLDDTDIPGILPTIGYLSARTHTAESIAIIVADKLRSPVISTVPVSSEDVQWEWGDWHAVGNEFVSKNQVWTEDFVRILTQAGREVPDFMGYDLVAEVQYDVAETCCRLLGGRLPSIEALKHLTSVEPYLLQARAIERGWCSYEWTRTRVLDYPSQVYAVGTTYDVGISCKYHGTVYADPEPRGARLAFRVARVTLPKYLNRENA